MDNKNDPINAALCQIVEQYGVEVLANSSKVIALLKDYAPKQGKEAKLIAAALREGIGAKLLQAVGLEENKQQQRITNCIQAFSEEMYITEDASRFAVESIASSIGLATVNDCVSLSCPQYSPKGTEEVAVGLYSPLTNLSPLVIDKSFTIKRGETREFKNCSITFLEPIICAGTIQFQSCSINCADRIGIYLGGDGDAKVEFDNCQMVGISCTPHNEFIYQDYAEYWDYDTDIGRDCVLLKNCVVKNCRCLISEGASMFLSVKISYCQIVEPLAEFLIKCSECEIKNSDFMLAGIDMCYDQYSTSHDCISSPKLDVQNVRISEVDTPRKYHLSPFGGRYKATFVNCQFNSLKSGVFCSFFPGSRTEFSKCTFDKCDTGLSVLDLTESEPATLNIRESTFSNCKRPIDSNFGGVIYNCRFINCDEPVVYDRNGKRKYKGEIIECQFADCTGVH